MTHNDVSYDPMDVFQTSQQFMKQSFQFWEQLTLQYSEGLLRNRQFLDMTGKAIENSLQFQQQIDRLVETAVVNMQLPTKGDMDRALHKLNEIEGLLHDLHEKVDRLIEQKQ
jgi:hypothetical protein